jgi:hypothetical protein
VVSVSSGSITYTGAIPGNSTYGLAKYSISGGNSQGMVTIARSGLTTFTIYFINGAGNDTQYTLTWSGNNLTVEENTDVLTTSVFNGTFYWYR